MTLGLIFCLSSMITISMYLTRWPLKWTQKYGSTFIGIASMLDAITSGCMFLSVAVFGGQCWRRDWLLYPNYNYLSWSYGFAVISFFGFALSAYLLYQEHIDVKEQKKQEKNLVMQMQTQLGPGSHAYV
ncbi:uncharacterized protein LOC136032227 [Artemia franciscana]|uniref:uncharacterized protein LOC136032227 n=1 Tax=Artemia franciscana TaxID=6661 RepID=UPI0032D9ED03